ncbi:MAG: DNA repair protein RecN [Deltaproteobacteria bacterium]|nr:DNA repair protein RecN [Deltaproteobacteria bacterium]MBW2048489.1 DNA repair protein RecN [Deltaproteobacteria bacterium]MBW2111074.1 DNA repair protein RecN [Deltaproteobacteria bacterium]MBW2354684.1 DNA repair protein RecN [Deltaproteobacteria bacterium]HDZ89898.1 DNA repair protein RecN [Deltaproteobacteria bacterium]
MLSQLNIADFAIIKHLELSLREGLNTLSGETGAGKSIIINAINLILGGRSSADLIRTGCDRAVVEGLFVFPRAPHELRRLLEQEGIPFEDELLIRRIISREGRNRVFINGSLSTLQTLSRLGPRLISISGQYEHQLLLKPDNHLFILDGFSGLEQERASLAELFRKYHSLKEDLDAVQRDITALRERGELAGFQIREIESINPVPGEDQMLGEERGRLQHAEELLRIVSDGYQSLYERDDSALASVSRCAREMERGAQMDGELAPVRDALSQIALQIEDVSFALRDLEKKIQVDPQRLEHVEERLELLKRLKRKYGATLEEVLQFKEGLAAKMFDMEEMEAKRTGFEKELEEARTRLVREARVLSGKRKKGAVLFKQAVEKELHHLHMEETEFEVRFEEVPGGEENGVEGMREEGLDLVEFMISPNPGEELRPLSKIASGGELSRIMLAIKTILSRTASVETLIFDEVDSGISGATAEVVGEKISSLAAYHQIVCITHLPQIACQGETHFLVKKGVIEGRTEATIARLDPERRIKEIARLLGGREITPRAVAHAREMLKRDKRP